MPDHHYLRSPYPLAIAHRGGAGEAPENTMSAFRYAYDLGFRYLETDVHLSADGQVVAFHDLDLTRLGATSTPINELSWAELEHLAVSPNDDRIPRLSDLYNAFPDASFNIDAKSDAVLGPLITTIRDHNAFERSLVASFEDQRIRRAQALAGAQLCLSSGRSGIIRSAARTYRFPAAGSRPFHVLQVPHKIAGRAFPSRRFVAQAHRDGLAVHVWTVDDPATIHNLLDIGVDGIMTDRPSILKAVYQERGIWLDPTTP